MADKELDTDIEPERQRLKDALGEDTSDMEILGYGVMYTVGADWNCIVPRDWLLDRINDLGIPQWIAPSKVAPHYAYDRAIKRMREDWDGEFSVEAPRLDNPDVQEDHRVTVDLKKGDGNRIWHVRGEVFFDEEESAQEGGTWDQHNLGHLMYDTETSSLIARKAEGLDEDDLLYSVWMNVVNVAEMWHDEMQEVHIAQDIRKMMYLSTRDYTNTVIQLRRSVYLFPAGMGDFVEKMATLYSEINEKFKETGEPVAVRTFEVLNTDDKQDWVQHKVSETLEDQVDDILEEAWEQFDEGEAADQVVKIIKQNLSGSADTAETYNALLEAEIDIEQALENQKTNLADDEKEDIVDRVLSQADINDF